MKFTTETLSKTLAGSLPSNKPVLTRKELIREKLQEDPDMIKRGYERGYVVFGDRAVFVRSRWEANLCAFFEQLKNTFQLTSWEYEPETFWFDGIKRGTNNYKPDFKLTYPDGNVCFIEVKGYWESKDTVKMNRMKKYHPKVNLMIIATTKCITKVIADYPGLILNIYARYELIQEKCFGLEGWGQPFKKKEEVQHLLDIIPKKEKPKKPKTSSNIKNKIVL